MNILQYIEQILTISTVTLSILAWYYKRKAQAQRIQKSYEQAKLEALHELYDKLIEQHVALNSRLEQQVLRLTKEIDRLNEENVLLAQEVERLTEEIVMLKNRLEER